MLPSEFPALTAPIGVNVWPRSAAVCAWADIAAPKPDTNMDAASNACFMEVSVPSKDQLL
jgi:hypothetical protein